MSATPASVTFEDGLGERHLVVERARNEATEILALRPELTSVPSFEFALRERVSHLSTFRHACYARVRTVERLKNPTSSLAVVSDATTGVRLSDLLAYADREQVTLDIDAALCLLRQLVPAVALLHEHSVDSAHGGTAHGAISPERLIVTPAARIVVVEHVLGAALGELRYPLDRYWKELRIAMPRSSAPPRFDHRSDVTQIAAVAVALILGRPLTNDETPARLGDVVASSWANSSRGGLEPLPAGLRAWLMRALQLDPKNWFDSAVDAHEELERVLGEGDYLAAPATLEAFLATYRGSIEHEAPAPKPEPRLPVAVRPSEPPAAPKRVERPSVIAAAPFEAPAPVAPPTPAADMSDLRRPAAPVARPAALPEVKFRFQAERDADEAEIEETAYTDSASVTSTRGNRTGGRGKWPLAAAGIALVILAAAGVPAARRYIAPPPPPSDGTLIVNTNPPGARVFIDGVERGVTPLNVALPPGTHGLELRGDGDPRLMPITVTAGAQSTQYIELAKASATTGQMHVRTEPAGARVTVDGVPRGTSPVTIADLTPGEHAVLLESDFGPVRQTVMIEAGNTASLTVPLVAAEGATVSGWMSIAAPADVQIFENGRLIGTSQSDRLMVTAGRHEIEIANDTLGYRVTRTVQVSPGKVTPIKIEFPNGTVALNATPWAEVWVDGEKIGDTPIGNHELTIGSHDFVFRHPDLGEQRHTAIVTLKTPARLSVDLRKK